MPTTSSFLSKTSIARNRSYETTAKAHPSLSSGDDRRIGPTPLVPGALYHRAILSAARPGSARPAASAVGPDSARATGGLSPRRPGLRRPGRPAPTPPGARRRPGAGGGEDHAGEARRA